jgi:gamma-glutamyl hercynylcysteine S-oxide synthase
VEGFGRSRGETGWKGVGNMHLAHAERSSGHALLERLAEARQQSDALFALVRPEFLYQRPIAERHRIIFYVGHLEAFDWNLLSERSLALKSFAGDLDHLFAFGIDPVGGGLPTDVESDWPRRDVVQGYVNRVRLELDSAIERAFRDGAASDEFPLDQLLQVAIEHRLMHAETLAYMLHQIPLDQKVRPAADAPKLTTPLAPRMVEIPAGIAVLGLRRDDSKFGWDNEYEQHTVQVPAFAIDQYKVTNGEFLKFVEGGGYQDHNCWAAADWEWIEKNGIEHPGFWLQRDGRWYQRTMFDEVLLPLDWPVYVSHAEANAYACWAGKALPTEAQWQRAAYGDGSSEANTAEVRGNFDFRRWDPTPVNAYPEGANEFGLTDFAGNGWEWTSTLFAPFPGFEPFPFYLGYSANFFDNQHYVMKGGSTRTAACLLRPTFRNWFQAHYPHVYAGFRCVKNSSL